LNIKLRNRDQQETGTGLVRRLGVFDATMVVMGGIIGSGIFMNPHVVAQIVHSPALILAAWFAGGGIALAGAFIYAELAGYTAEAGGQYIYLRESYHPLVAFLFGWSLFLVSNSGGMAAVAITFARYSIELTGANIPETGIAVVTILLLTIVNCFGVRSGSTVQNILMIMKILAILFLIIFGYALTHPAAAPVSAATPESDALGGITAFGAALVPVMFAFGGWQTANFIAGEIREPQKNLARGLLLGVIGVVILYAGVNLVCIRALGASGLAATKTPASEVMALAFGSPGAKLIAIGIAISTLGFLSQSVLTAPRVYFAMAKDGLFFRQVATLHPVSRVPVLAIVLQGLFAMLVALSGTYEQILSYVVSDDFIFFGLTAGSLFILRRKLSSSDQTARRFRMPGHPVTTLLFIAVCVCIVANTIYKYPVNTLIGIAIMIAGIPVFYIWRKQFSPAP
jgi:APA family basic amino acid/polyamine antiporter